MTRARPRPFRYLITQGTILQLVLMLFQRSRFKASEQAMVDLSTELKTVNLHTNKGIFQVSFLMRRMLTKAIK